MLYGIQMKHEKLKDDVSDHSRFGSMDHPTAVIRTEWFAEPVRNMGREGCQSTEVMAAVCSRLVWVIDEPHCRRRHTSGSENKSLARKHQIAISNINHLQQWEFWGPKPRKWCSQKIHVQLRNWCHVVYNFLYSANIPAGMPPLQKDRKKGGEGEDK